MNNIYTKKERIQGYATGIVATITGTLLVLMLIQQNEFVKSLNDLLKGILSLSSGGFTGFGVGLWLFEKVKAFKM